MITANMNNRGSVMVVMVVVVVVLLGMTALAFDVGRMAIAKQRAQMVCDAAALAGGSYLTGEPSSTEVSGASGLPAVGDGDAARAAKYAAMANNEAAPYWATYTIGSHQPGVTVSFPPYPADEGTVTADNGDVVNVSLGEAIRVRAVVSVPTTFARVFGVGDAWVYAEATAIATGSEAPAPTTVTASPIPWAVADTTIWDLSTNPPGLLIELGTSVVLKITSPSDPEGFIGSGNFLPVAFGGDTGANRYRERLEGVYGPVTFELGNDVDLTTEPGNMMGPTMQGLEERFNGDVYPYPAMNDTAWDAWIDSYDPATGERADTMRVGLIPIIEDPGGALHGRSSLTVVGFAGVFIEGFEIDADGYLHVVARFTSGIYSADGVTWIDPYTDPPYSSTVASVRLLS